MTTEISPRDLLEQELRETGVAWNPLDINVIANPYPTYRQLLERDPYHYSAVTNMWLVSRYDDVNEMIVDWERFSNVQEDDGDPARDGPDLTDASMLNRDPLDHTRLRGLVSRAFTQRQVSRMEDRVREIAHGLLDEVADSDEFDLMANLASMLPTIVIAEMIGVPTEQRAEFRQWSDDFILGGNPGLTPDQQQRAADAAVALYEYFNRHVELRRDSPADDLTTRLIEAHEEGDRLSRHEMISTLNLLLLAGNETTTNLIGNGAKALIENPDQLELLRSQPELLPNAIEELLRYDPPVQMDPKTAAADMQLGNRTVHVGDRVAFVLAAANRDPAEFDDPDQLDITREHNNHIAFGRGIHFCLGSPLARLEGRIAFEVLLERFEQIEFGSSAPSYKPNSILRGMDQFPIKVERARTYTGTS